MSQTTPLHRLTTSIIDGRCIAFVGAGFCVPAVPGWQQLLADLTQHIQDPAAKADVTRWLGQRPLGSRDLEGIGQTVHSLLGDGFHRALADCLQGKEERIRQRLEWLRGIPFHYVLTTNFDRLLGDGDVPGTEAYAKAIMAPTRRWSHGDYWPFWGEGAPEPTLWHRRLMRLHGGVAHPERPIVFTTRSYRRLVHGDPAYRGFLRTMFATHNVLYVGFSFTDAYINDLRSEILAMVGLHETARRGMDFAILDDVSEATAKHLSEHDGLQVLGFTKPSPTDYGGFDGWLERIWRKTNPPHVLRDRIRERRILWLDPKPRNNDLGFRIMTSPDGSNGALVERATTVEEALERLKGENDEIAGGGYDLVITHWGYRVDGDANGQRLLQGLRTNGVFVPVVVFSTRDFRHLNRPRALRLGALAYTHEWGELFGVIERLFTDES